MQGWVAPMRRLTVLAVGIAVSIAVLPLVPGAGAQLPQDKDWSWQRSVEGDLREVAVCEGEACASAWTSAATANSGVGGSQDNLYSFERDGDIARAFNPESTDQSGFEMTGTDVDDAGEMLVGVSDQRTGLTAEDDGPFWILEARAGGDTLAVGDNGDNIENAGGSDDRKLVTWLPGLDAWAMIRDPPDTGGDGRIWVYTGERNTEPFFKWDKSGESIGGSDAVAVEATSELVVAGYNDGGSANVRFYRQTNPNETDTIDDNDGVDAQLHALATSRAKHTVVLGTEDRALIYRAAMENKSLEVDRIAPAHPGSAVTTAAVSDDGRLFAIGGSFGISVYRVTGDPDDPITRLWTWSQSVTEIDMSGDGRYLASIDGSGVRVFWNTAPEGMRPAPIWTNSDIGTPVSIDTGYAGSGTVVGSSDGNVYFFDLDYSLDATIDPSSKSLQPGQANEFTLTLDNQGDAVQDITLSATGAQADWVGFRTDNGTGAPLSGVTVLPGRSRTVTVEVTPPPGTAAGSSFSATVHATIDSSPDDATETVSISGSVEESYGVNLDADPDSLSIEQGEQRTVDVTVTNAGNLQDTIVLDVGSLSSGWTATLDRNSFSLAAGASDNTTLTIRAPDQADQGVTEEVRLLGTSQGNPSKQGQLSIPATVGPSRDVSLSGPGTVEARAGQATPIDVTVENIGNQASTFELSAEGPGTWAIAVSSDTVTLGARETADAVVTVNPPSDASGAATVTLTAVAQGDASVSSELKIIVRATQGFLGLPGFGTVAAVAAVATGLFAVSRRRR